MTLQAKVHLHINNFRHFLAVLAKTPFIITRVIFLHAMEMFGCKKKNTSVCIVMSTCAARDLPKTEQSFKGAILFPTVSTNRCLFMEYKKVLASSGFKCVKD